jgi:hypothetical protein
MKSTHSKAHELHQTHLRGRGLQDYKVYPNDMQARSVRKCLAQVQAQEKG